MRKLTFSCLLFANLKAKSSRTTSEFSGMDEKLCSSTVKLAGRNDVLEMF
ncbi:MAG: hypothetical protein WCJ72_05705 [Chryseobacterium sp.]